MCYLAQLAQRHSQKVTFLCRKMAALVLPVQWVVPTPDFSVHARAIILFGFNIFFHTFLHCSKVGC